MRCSSAVVHIYMTRSRGEHVTYCAMQNIAQLKLHDLVYRYIYVHMYGKAPELHMSREMISNLCIGRCTVLHFFFVMYM